MGIHWLAGAGQRQRIPHTTLACLGLCLATLSTSAQAASSDEAVRRAVATYARVAKKAATIAVTVSPSLQECLKTALKGTGITRAVDQEALHKCFSAHGPDSDMPKQIAASEKAEEALKACEAAGAINKCHAAGMRAFALGLEKTPYGSPPASPLLPNLKAQLAASVVFVGRIPVAIVMTPFTLVIDEVGRGIAETLQIPYAHNPPMEAGTTGAVWAWVGEGSQWTPAHGSNETDYKSVAIQMACNWRGDAEWLDPNGGSLGDRLAYTGCRLKGEARDGTCRPPFKRGRNGGHDECVIHIAAADLPKAPSLKKRCEHLETDGKPDARIDFEWTTAEDPTYKRSCPSGFESSGSKNDCRWKDYAPLGGSPTCRYDQKTGMTLGYRR